MINDYINISKIETHLCSVLRKNVCARCYAGTLPSTLKDKMDTYVVIDCGGSISDLHAYGKGAVNIYLYARPNGVSKNVAELSKMESKFMKALREDKFDSEHYRVARDLMYQDTGYDSTYGMHFIIKAIHLTIL